MNRAIFLSSFFSIQFSASKFLISPAIWQSKPAMSNAVTRAMPLLPDSKLLQTSSVPMPQQQTKPIPVTTTRRFKRNFSCSGRNDSVGLLLSLGVLFDVLDGVLHRRDLFCVLIRYFDAECFLEGHDQLDRVKRVGAEVVHKRSAGGHFAFIYTELLDNNLLHAFFDAGHSGCSSDFSDL